MFLTVKIHRNGVIPKRKDVQREIPTLARVSISIPIGHTLCRSRSLLVTRRVDREPYWSRYVEEAHHCTWVRFGAAAPFSQNAVLHALVWRVGQFADLPAELREYIDDEAPMWRDAPKDLEEIERLQTAQSEDVVTDS